MIKRTEYKMITLIQYCTCFIISLWPYIPKTCRGFGRPRREPTALALFHRHAAGPRVPSCCGTRGTHRCGLGAATSASEWLGAHGSLDDLVGVCSEQKTLIDSNLVGFDHQT